MKNKIIILMLFFTTIVSCKKDKIEVKIVREYSNELKQWANFQEGSWWIYKDIISNSFLDTIYLNLNYS